MESLEQLRVLAKNAILYMSRIEDGAGLPINVSFQFPLFMKPGVAVAASGCTTGSITDASKPLVGVFQVQMQFSGGLEQVCAVNADLRSFSWRCRRDNSI